MNRNKAYITIEYEGIAYFLCCPRCQSEFERKPQAYAQPEFGQKVKEERAIRALLAEAQADAVAGLNWRDPQAMSKYSATVSEGAQAAGLSETEQAYRDLIVALPANSTVQVHSFDLSSLEVHEDAGLARATYRLHFSLVRGNAVVFSAKATHNLALLKTARGWRISGGDALQFEDMNGTWPP